MTWTQPVDIINRWMGGGEPNVDDPKLLVFIEDAEDAILSIYPEIQSRIDDDSLPITRIKRVTARIIERAWKTAGNPLSSFSRSVGPFSESGSFSNESKKHISLSAEDIADLAPKSYRFSQMDVAPNLSLPNDRLWNTITRIR